MNRDSNNASVQAVSSALQNRRTTKAMDETPWPCPAQDPRLLAEILAAASEAPFHKPAAKEARLGKLDGIQPWRCYHLDAAQCRKLRTHLLQSGDATKIPKMLAVADYLVQATWLPNPPKAATQGPFEPSIQNMEHIAAASAAIQNMLLAATARGIPNYWSSGGALREPDTFSLLGIPTSEILLGSLFLFPSDLSAAQTSHGSLRASRSPLRDWSRPVYL